MEASPDELSVERRYKLLTGLVVPRPIAWVSSISVDRTLNLAPFSYFSIASHSPLSVSISVNGRKPDGSWKDTGLNLMPAGEGGTGEFVVNIVTERQAGGMARSSRPVPAAVSEFALAGVEPVPSRRIAPPRVAGAPASFECRTTRVVEIGGARLFVGEVIHIAVEDALLDERGRVDFDRLAAIGRLAGTSYARIADRLDLPDEGYAPAPRRAGP